MGRCKQDPKTGRFIKYNLILIKSNLISLCMSCHIKTNKNRDLWTIQLSKKLEVANGV